MSPEESNEKDTGDCWWFPEKVCLCVQESMDERRDIHERSRRVGYGRPSRFATLRQMCLPLGHSWEGFAPQLVLPLASSWEDFLHCAEQVFSLRLLIRCFFFTF